jgi:hypothetical protein
VTRWRLSQPVAFLEIMATAALFHDLATPPDALFSAPEGPDQPDVGASAGGSCASGSGSSTAPTPPQIPDFNDPTNPPGEGWEWRGPDSPGGDRGGWYNPETGETLHPDLGHPDPIGPHWDWTDPSGDVYRIGPDGIPVPK